MKGFWIALLCLMQASVVAHAQKVTLSERNAPLESVFRKVQAQAGVSFVYTKTELSQAKPVTLQLTNVSLDEALQACFQGQPLKYTREGKYVVVKPAPATPVQPAAPADHDVTGRLTDEEGAPVIRASIAIKGTQQMTTSDEKGNFRFDGVAEDAVIVVRSLGFAPVEVPLRGRSTLKVVMKRTASQIGEVVISTGMFTRKKESFTGATATYTGEQLKTVGNQDVIKSLRTLDPSFIVVPNNVAGSNPNARPTIEVRGQTGISGFNSQLGIDPNQPLFILDGFEVDMQQIVDLDINRVASITLLKDAASTAIYGAKAANGVVVVETLQPKPGKMQLSYSADFTIDGADLRDYNLMNAAEKLEFERLAGRYKYINQGVTAATQYKLDEQYNARLAAVASGVNTYWLAEPLQTAVTQRHSLFASGGDNNVRYSIGGSYRRNNGIMIGSFRDTWGVNADLQYRKGRLNITNKAVYTGVKGEESPYGSFSLFTRTNPYYTKYDENGDVSKYLDYSIDTRTTNSGYIRNPLYDATLNSYNESRSNTVTDNLAFIYSFNNYLRATAGISIGFTNSVGESFLDPRHASFETVITDLKGRYTTTRNENSSLQSYLSMSYGRTFTGGHQVSANFRGDVRSSSSKSFSSAVVGFPVGSNGNPKYATSYDPNSTLPGYGDAVSRNASGTAALNYSFRNRFLMDASARYDVSTSFGSNQYAHPFWSLGAGWNLHQEPMFKHITFINRLKLFVNTGTSSNQSYTGLGSSSVYTFSGLYNALMGQSLQISQVGNPDLMWPITTATNTGIELSMFKSRINVNLNYFTKVTANMVVPISTPLSTGYSTYNTNVGGMRNKGLELMARFTPWADAEKRAAWNITLTGLYQDSKFGGIGNALAQENSKFQNDSSLALQYQKYADGRSQYDLWAVRSLGIDPATGKEVYLTKDGVRTFTYNANDKVVVGSSRPDLEGVIGTNFAYKGFSFSVSIRYRIGGSTINSAVYEKVENLDYTDVYVNQDRRALYDRWKKPGDIAQFSDIASIGGTTKAVSSRFVQEDSNITGESFSLGYSFDQVKWISRAGLKNLRVNAYMNDFWRRSTIRAERGLDYPFARSGSFSINASF
ncbi:SusC/RagA family TonB-linked outer membrane protein [Chitinophaga lutea]